MVGGPFRGRFPYRGPAAGPAVPARLVRRPRIRGRLDRRGSGRRAASGLALLGAPVAKIKFRIRNEARRAAAPPADRFGGPAPGREGTGAGPAGRGPAWRGANAACGTGGWRLTRPGFQGTVPANPGSSGRPAVPAGAGPLRRAVPDCRCRAGLGVGFGTVPAPARGRGGPVRGGRFSGGLPGPAGARPIQARLLWRRGQVAVHARPTGRDRTTTRKRPTGRHRGVAAPRPATIGGLVGRRPRTTPGIAAGIRVTRRAGILTRCRGPPAPRGARLASATRIASARIPPGIVRPARGGRRETPPALAGVRSPSLTRDCTARCGGPGVTGHFAWGGGAHVAAGPVAGCAGPVVAAGRLPGRGRVVPGRLRIPGGGPPALAWPYLGVLRWRVRAPGQVTGVVGSGIGRATRPPPTRRSLRALVGHLSPCRASDAILPDRESPHHEAWQRCLPPGLARSSTRARAFAAVARFTAVGPPSLTSRPRERVPKAGPAHRGNRSARPP